ncbi:MULTISPECIES: hypothetical protein [Bacillus]|nr:hypothetical protein [Bacillus cereus group sp. N17]EOP29451.1 hypothetical protein IIS_05127 [Bacillus cereus VD131]MBJ8042456.1 hypothetical protein [Bacillus cereus group sp. N17]
MTNPGSFDFKNTKGWDDFKNGQFPIDFVETKDYADQKAADMFNYLFD